jgi:hypothetical protein
LCAFSSLGHVKGRKTSYKAQNIFEPGIVYIIFFLPLPSPKMGDAIFISQAIKAKHTQKVIKKHAYYFAVST